MERSADWLAQATGAASGGAYVVSGAPDARLTIYFSGHRRDGRSTSASPAFGDFELALDGAVVADGERATPTPSPSGSR